MKDRGPPAHLRIPQNVVDKAIAYFAPRVAQRRAFARLQLALAGGYSGAKLDRAALAGWRSSANSPEADVIPDLPALRARSRDLERNAPVAAGVIGTTVTHVVGTGLACNPQIDGEFLGLTEDEAQAWEADTKRRFRTWAESQDVDLARQLNFYGLQDLSLRTTLASGDAFVVTPRIARAGRAARLALQLIEADRVSNPPDKRTAANISDGVEFDVSTGEAIAYHICDRHPTEFAGGARKWTRIAARGDNTGRRNVLHLFKPLRPGLKRGVPILAPVIEPLKQLSRYTEAELHAAVVSGLYTLFITMDPKAFEEMFQDDAKQTIIDRAGKWSGDIESGAKAVNLLPGESIVSHNPGRPNAQFDPFVQACIRQIGMAIGIPYEVLVMHYQSSYSAARGALLTAWRFFMGWRDWLATSLCQPVYELWLADEIVAGRIAAAGFFADEVVRHAWSGAQWVGDGPGSIDPSKEVDAAAKRVELGISTLQAESILHDGVDWETKHRQRVKEMQAQQRDGTAPAPAPAPADDDEDDDEDETVPVEEVA
jgi:lambda family phage portal protein